MSAVRLIQCWAQQDHGPAAQREQAMILELFLGVLLLAQAGTALFGLIFPEKVLTYRESLGRPKTWMVFGGSLYSTRSKIRKTSTVILLGAVGLLYLIIGSNFLWLPANAKGAVLRQAAKTHYCVDKRLSWECADFQVNEKERQSLSPSDKRNGYQDKWCATVHYTISHGNGWEDGGMVMLTAYDGDEWRAWHFRSLSDGPCIIDGNDYTPSDLVGGRDILLEQSNRELREISKMLYQ